jgi:hypothetical protein
MTVGWVSLGHKGNVHGDVCVQRGGIGEGGCEGLGARWGAAVCRIRFSLHNDMVGLIE